MPRRPDESAERTPLGRALLDLRLAAGLSGTAAGEALSPPRTQSAISRWESGRDRPTSAQIEQLVGAYGASAAERRRLIRLAKALAGSTSQPARVVMRRAERMQRQIGAHEAAATTIRVFQPNVVCGPVQTEAYARAVFAGGLPAAQVDAATTARMDRQELLDDPARTFTLLHGEGALRWQIAGPGVMAEQCDRLAGETREHVRVGLIPWDVAAPASVLHGFDVYDQTKVVVGTLAGTAFLDATDSQHRGDVADHVRLFGQLEEVALFGDEARERFADMAARYRRLV